MPMWRAYLSNVATRASEGSPAVVATRESLTT